jgi:hypothetical protein
MKHLFASKSEALSAGSVKSAGEWIEILRNRSFSGDPESETIRDKLKYWLKKVEDLVL